MAVNTPNEYMNNSYTDLVKQTFNYPQEDFETKDGYLYFNGLDLKEIIDKYGTPLKLTYLPKIGMQIKKAKKMFANAFKKHRYEGTYNYSYCTKSSHFSFVVEEALKHAFRCFNPTQVRPCLFFFFFFVCLAFLSSNLRFLRM